MASRRVIATGPIALPAVALLSLFIPRQHIARRCPLLVLRRDLVCWCGTVRGIIAIPLLVIGTIGMCVLMMAVSCLAIAGRSIVIPIIAIPTLGVLLFGWG